MSNSPSPRSTPAPQTNARAAPPNNSADITNPSQQPNSMTSSSTNQQFIPSWRRPTLTTTGDGRSERQPSVQFVPHVKTDGADSPRSSSAAASRSHSAQPTHRLKLGAALGDINSHNNNKNMQRRLSSPPPPAQFRPGVSFDTFSNKAASNFSLTLNRKHVGYEYSKRSRTFLCGTDMNEYSDTALEWLIEELVDDGDEVVCLRVVEKDSKEAVKWAGGMGEKGYRREAQRFLEAIEKKNSEDRAISLVLEFAVGKVQETIQQMIRIYEPALLVVGTRGRSLTGYSGLLSSGSVSKYCLQYSPVPVIVVRPSSKREAKKRKRLQDPTRTGYRDILDKDEDHHGGRGGHLLDARNRKSIMGSDLGALGELDPTHTPDQEARMVAEAIGYRDGGDGEFPKRPSSAREQRDSSLSRVTSTQSDASSARSVGSERLMKSPDLQTLDSLNISDESDSDDDDSVTRLPEGVVRPEDEALALAYERAQKISEEEQEEAEARAERERARKERGFSSRSRSRKGDDDGEEGRGAAALGLLAQLDRGLR